jgi:hypothetical protein
MVVDLSAGTHAFLFIDVDEQQFSVAQVLLPTGVKEFSHGRRSMVNGMQLIFSGRSLAQPGKGVR